ncbi:ribulose-5-phosphate 3-epimerase [Bellilinea caldifistulae]|uniref:Ribulose-phosphate 3-epimerase n=1 Tax=Bellilinea caldifistulae TaxID=360411 RepID=A0A0P6XP56_9CHLR|nr:ribulose-phosphate 3-epimerase [Bellilinea caldifistulae]KPL78397.1 ribulose-phosphate 3-epimerase [Bellilinea caldifistulae]GAP10693.1 ribulose-5-phosphate 3-epimerase [Bellilinea caldifistulae]
MYYLSASILSADFANLADQIRQAEDAGVDWIHIDVMDGHFVPNITMGPFIVETCRRITSLPLDVHLMIEKPENHIQSFINAGANWVSIHIEGNSNVHRTLQVIQSQDAKAGIVLNPGTPAQAIEAVLPFTDLVLVMTVNPGFSGQSFIPQMVEKISSIKKMMRKTNPDAILQVDGGINPQNISAVAQAGANCFVAATAIFKHPQGIAEGVNSLRKQLQQKMRLSPQIQESD